MLRQSPEGQAAWAVHSSMSTEAHKGERDEWEGCRGTMTRGRYIEGTSQLSGQDLDRAKCSGRAQGNLWTGCVTCQRLWTHGYPVPWQLFPSGATS